MSMSIFASQDLEELSGNFGRLGVDPEVQDPVVGEEDPRLHVVH